MDVLIWVTPYLEKPARACLRSVATLYKLGPTYGPLWFSRPWQPNRRRRWGFGIPSMDRTVVNDVPPPHLFLHFIWQYLSPPERLTMTTMAPPADTAPHQFLRFSLSSKIQFSVVEPVSFMMLDHRRQIQATSLSIGHKTVVLIIRLTIAQRLTLRDKSY
mgnify:CR=1 FL=1